MRRVASRRTVLLALCCSLAAGGAAAQSARTNPRAGIEFYLQTYGRVPVSEALDVYAVFEKVRGAADKSSLVTPQLIVVGDAKQASAFALSDGTIFLSTKALAIIRESATPAQVRARLAFVLGHELAHLASNDFWDNQISQALLESSTARELNAQRLNAIVNTSAGQEKKELKADDLGFVYAALAGYDVDSLLQPSGSNQDFLSFWNAKAGNRSDSNYPEAAQRASLLRQRLAEMRDAVHSFEFGSRLMHFGRYREAIGLLREYQKQFPGRELFNNLGYCHLRLAASQLDPEFAYHYWLPMISDLNTTLTRMTTRSAEGSVDRKQWRMSAAARDGLLQAASYFELAISKDSGYAPSYVNLSTAHLLLGMDKSSARLQTIDSNHLLHAKIAIDSALQLQPDNEQARVMAAIVENELQPTDRGRLDSALTKIAAKEAVSLYNLAQLTANEPERSAEYWRRLGKQFDSLPKKLQSMVCRQPGKSSDDLKQPCSAVVTNPLAVKMPWPLPVKLSRDLLDAPFTDAELRQHAWQKKSLASGTAYLGASNAVLAIDDITTLAILRRVSATPETLLQCCSQPLERIPLASGTLWHYGRWAALVSENGVTEVWASN